VIQPPRAGLVEQRDRAEQADPLVGIRRHLRLGRTAAQTETVQSLEERLRPWRLEVHAEAEPEGEHVVQGDRPVGRDGVAVDRSPPVDEHPPVGELWEQVVDGIVEPQAALLQEDQCGDGGHRLAHRGDAEDRVPLHRGRLAAGQRAGDADLDVLVTGRQPGDAADGAVLDVPGHDLAQPGDPARVESTHASFDPTSGRNSSRSPDDLGGIRRNRWNESRPEG
jgi:hypothetical protein